MAWIIVIKQAVTATLARQITQSDDPEAALAALDERLFNMSRWAAGKTGVDLGLTEQCVTALIAGVSDLSANDRRSAIG